MQNLVPPRRWIDNIGSPNELISKLDYSFEVVIRKMNLICMSKKIASGCYQELVEEHFLNPKKCLDQSCVLRLLFLEKWNCLGLLQAYVEIIYQWVSEQMKIYEKDVFSLN